MGMCGSGGCCGPRSFLTNEERMEMLKEYQESLEKEAQGVKETIEKLKNK